MFRDAMRSAVNTSFGHFARSAVYYKAGSQLISDSMVDDPKPMPD
jgi:hypothetical protein